MVKRRRKLWVLLMTVAMMVTMLSGFSASAEEGTGTTQAAENEAGYSLAVANIEWDGEDTADLAFPKENFSSTGFGAYLYTHTVFAIGLMDEDRVVTPISVEDYDKFFLIDEEGNPVDTDKYYIGIIEYEDENGEEVTISIDGVIDLVMDELGTYYLAYPSGEDMLYIGFMVTYPMVGCYHLDGSAIGYTIEYGKERNFIIKKHENNFEDYKETITITNISATEDLVEIKEAEDGYEIVIPEGVDNEFRVQLDYTLNYAYYEADEWHENEWVNSVYFVFTPEDTEIPVNKWKKTGNKWYYYDSEGNMEKNAYRSGWYLGADGVWDGKAKVPGWKKNSKGWWYDLGGGDYLKNGWKKIDGIWYYFKADGYAAAGEWINGYWLSANCKWIYKPRGSWHKNSKGWWYGDTAGWYAKNEKVKIDGVEYSFNSDGYLMPGFH